MPPEPGRKKRLPTIWAGVFCVLWTFPVDLPLWTLAASRQQQTSSCGPPLWTLAASRQQITPGGQQLPTCGTLSWQLFGATG